MRPSQFARIAICVLLAQQANAQYYGQEYEGEQVPRREGEQLVIPLDTGDPRYSACRTPREDLQGGRPPGAFDPNRFSGGYAWQAVPTFFAQPMVLTPEDLVAAKADVAIFGAFTDMGSGMRGAATGPNAMRGSESFGARATEFSICRTCMSWWKPFRN